MTPIGNKLLAVQMEGERVVLHCRRGAADDLTFYSRREFEEDYTALDDDGERAVDARPKIDPARPEVRRYYAMLLYSGEENRMKSNEIVITLP